MPPQLLLFFNLPYSQLIRYSNIINHQRQEQLAVFSKSGSNIPSSTCLTPIKAFLSALFTSATLVLTHILFVKLSMYINCCKIVHKCRIYAATSGNCSHRREPRVWSQVAWRHTSTARMQSWPFTHFFSPPTARLRHLPRVTEYLLSAAIRRIITSITESHQQMQGTEHRKLQTTAPLTQQWITLCNLYARMSCRSRWIPQHTFQTLICINNINMHCELLWITRRIYLVWKLHFLFLLNESAKGAEHRIQVWWWVGAF